MSSHAIASRRPAESGGLATVRRSLGRGLARRRLPLLVGLVVLAAGLGLRVAAPELVERGRLQAFDAFQRAAPRPYTPLPVRIVDIDDQSLERLGQWPWPRRELARLVDRLTLQGAAAIAFDMVFAEPDRTSPAHLASALATFPEGLAQALRGLPDYDDELARSFAGARVVTGFGLVAAANGRPPLAKAGFAMLGDPAALDGLSRFGGSVVNLPALERAATGNGSFSMVAGSDDVIRQMPLLQSRDGQTLPSLAVEALRVAQGAGTLKFRAGADGRSLRIGRLDVPVDAGGRMWLHFTKPAAERTIPAWQVLAPTIAGDVAAGLRGSIVLIGTSATGLKDLRATPLDPFTAGVAIHAAAIEQMLSGDFLQRPDWAAGAEFAAMAALGLVLLAAFACLPARWSAVLLALAVAAPVACCWFAFRRHGLLLDPVAPTLLTLAIYLAVSSAGYVRSERQRGQIRRAFASYMAPALVDELVAHPERLQLGGESRVMTFLFTDLAGFTAFMERAEPDRVVQLLNDYLDGVCQIVMEHGGTVDKIVGDAVHAIFNAPMDQPDHAARAVRCALAIDAFARAFEARQAAAGNHFGTTRIGVNTGAAIIGNFGGRRRFDYTAHGDAINTAARLEGANKQLGTRICVAGSTAAACGPELAFRPIGRLTLVGKSQGVDAFEPLPSAVEDQAVAAYRAAFAALESGAAGAVDSFAELARLQPLDPLAALHACRLARGQIGTSIQLDGK